MTDNGWHDTTLGEQVELLTGFPFKSEKYTDDRNGIPLLRGDNIVQGRFRWENVKRWPTLEIVEAFAPYFLNIDDVVIAMDRPWIEAGLKYAFVSTHDLPCLLVQRVARLRAKKTLDQGFLRYIIGSSGFTNHVLGVQTGTAVPHISADQIKEYRFLLPSLSEQRAIASILGVLDQKIELNQRMNDTLEGIARALFKSWFVDFDPVKAKAEGRKPESMDDAIFALFPSDFIDSSTEQIPEGWTAETLERVSFLNSESWSHENTPDQIEYVDLANTKWGTIESTQFISWKDAPSRAQRILRKGDAIVGTVRPGIGCN